MADQKLSARTETTDYTGGEIHIIKDNGSTWESFRLKASNLLAGLEPEFSKNTGFNKNFGSTSGTVSEGNHLHTDVYALAAQATQWENVTGGINYSGGNVGIGTDTPAYHQAIYSTTPGGDWLFSIGNGNINRSLTIGVHSDISEIQAHSWNGTPSANPTNLALNPSGGNVYVGASTGTEKFEVTGNIKATGEITAYAT